MGRDEDWRKKGLDHLGVKGSQTKGRHLKPVKREAEIRRMKPDDSWQRMASAGERPGNLNRFGADGFPSKLAESLPSSSCTVATGNFFNATKTPSGGKEAAKRTTGDTVMRRNRRVESFGNRHWVREARAGSQTDRCKHLRVSTEIPTGAETNFSSLIRNPRDRKSVV